MASDDGLNPVDRDAMIRTVLTEAASQDPEGWGAVASVIRNRLAAGNYGATPSAVVTAPGQFEVWQNGRAQRVDPKSDAYQAAGRVVDAVAAGGPDNTGGATHFYSPAGQASLGRGAPAWGGRNVTARIGGQVFAAPHGAVRTTTEAPSPTPADPQPQAQQPMAGKLDVLKGFGVNVDGSTGPAVPQPVDHADVFSQFGVDTSLKSNGPNAVPAASTRPAVQAGDDAAAVGRGIINGVPVAGPYLLGGVNRLAAAARALSKDEPYSQALQEVQGFGDATAAEHPIATGIGQAAGAAVGMAPLVAAAPGALGLQGASMLGRMAAGGASNALLNAADAGVRGEDIVTGAAAGGLGGFAGPLAGRVVGASVNKLGAYLSNVTPTGIPGISRSAANLINQTINADDPAAVQAVLAQHGPMATLADAGPSTTGLASALALKPSEAKSIITNRLTERAGGANDRIAAQIDASLGPAEDPGMVARNIADLRSDNASQAYTAAHAAAPPVDVSGVAAKIDDALQTATGNQKKALQAIRAELVESPPPNMTPEQLAIRGEKFKTDSRTLQNLRQDIDLVIDHSEPGLGVPAGAVARAQASLRDVRGSLNGALHDQVPGLAAADADFAALSQRQAAVDKGFNKILGGNGPNPETFAADRAAAAPGVNIAENKGIRGRVDRMFGTGTQRDAVTLNKLLAGGDDGYAAANLRTAFGDEPANALLDTLAREKAFNATTNEVLQNSATARRTAANKLLEESQPGSLNLSSASAAGLALQAGKSMVVDPLMRMILESPNASRNVEMARMLTAQGASRDQIFAALQRLNGRQQTVGAVGNFLQGALGSGANRLMLAAGAATR